jgi:hypothetical protein
MIWSLPFFLLDVIAGAGNPARMSDAIARSVGSDQATARAIAFRIFARIEPLQVMKVRVDVVGTHHIAGIKLSGVKFHGSVDRKVFVSEIRRLAFDAMMASSVEEVDIEVTVPLSEQHGLTVAGDGQLPSDSTVFTVSVRRGEALTSLTNRIQRGEGVFCDPVFGREVGLNP